MFDKGYFITAELKVKNIETPSRLNLESSKESFDFEKSKTDFCDFSSDEGALLSKKIANLENNICKFKI